MNTKAETLVLLRILLLIPVISGIALTGCYTAKKSTVPTPVPPPGPNRPARMDTIRWTAPTGQAPPIGAPTQGNRPDPTPVTPGAAYRIAVVLPFLTEQFDTDTTGVPQKSEMALQFYGGAQLALQQLSTDQNLKLSVEFIDSHADDADFKKVIASGKLDRAQVIIGPVRSSHVEILAQKTRENRQILLSPVSPVSELTADNPDFLQFNPSLRAHCTAITNFVRKDNEPGNIVLVCKAKEANRLPYFQGANAALGGDPLREIIVPDEATSFEKIDFAPYYKPGRTTVFIMPSWASQDFVMAFLRKIKATKGGNTVQVFGMPQWENFENIEPEYLKSLNVHISSATFVDRSHPRVKEFEQKFVETYHTIPDENAVTGYDAVLYAGKMLRWYGLSFPEKAGLSTFEGLRLPPVFQAVYGTTTGNAENPRTDYLENTAVRILKFEMFKFVPVN